jgi:hypothetical protein
MQGELQMQQACQQDFGERLRYQVLAASENYCLSRKQAMQHLMHEETLEVNIWRLQTTCFSNNSGCFIGLGGYHCMSQSSPTSFYLPVESKEVYGFLIVI